MNKLNTPNTDITFIEDERFMLPEDRIITQDARIIPTTESYQKNYSSPYLFLGQEVGGEIIKITKSGIILQIAIPKIHLLQFRGIPQSTEPAEVSPLIELEKLKRSFFAILNISEVQDIYHHPHTKPVEFYKRYGGFMNVNVLFQPDPWLYRNIQAWVDFALAKTWQKKCEICTPKLKEETLSDLTTSSFLTSQAINQYL